MVALQEKDVLEWILGHIGLEELTERISNNPELLKRKMREAYSKGSHGLAKFMGKKIRELRNGDHLTHKEFSDKLGTGYNGSGPWESGDRPPPLAALYMAIYVFKLKPSEFLPSVEDFAKWSGLE